MAGSGAISIRLRGGSSARTHVSLSCSAATVVRYPQPSSAKASLGPGLTAVVVRAEEYYSYVTGELTRRMALAARGAA